MSITFYPSVEWKIIKVACTICAVCEKEDDPFCTGFIDEPDCPTINMANGNARAMLVLMGLPADDCCGEVSVKELPAVFRAMIKAQNTAGGRRDATEDPYKSGGPGTGQCRVVSMGRDDSYITRRLNDLMELAHYCQENDCGFYWA